MISLVKVPRKGVSYESYQKGSGNIPLLLHISFGKEKTTQCIECNLNGRGWVSH